MQLRFVPLAKGAFQSLLSRGSHKKTKILSLFHTLYMALVFYFSNPCKILDIRISSQHLSFTFPFILPHSFISPAHSLLTHLLLSLQTKNMRETEPWVIGYYAIIASVIVFIFLIILMLFCCCTDCCNANRGQQPNSSIEPSPTVLPVHASSINNN